MSLSQEERERIYGRIRGSDDYVRAAAFLSGPGRFDTQLPALAPSIFNDAPHDGGCDLRDQSIGYSRIILDPIDALGAVQELRQAIDARSSRGDSSNDAVGIAVTRALRERLAAYSLALKDLDLL